MIHCEILPSYFIIEAPSPLGLRPSGVEDLPQALLSAGLSRRLGATHIGRVKPPTYDPRRGPANGIANEGAIHRYSHTLADMLADNLRAGHFPIVLGGDCSILLGPMLALRRMGRYGLFFLDGHADFYQPDAEPRGEAASMELALISGRGPSMLADIDGLGPLARDKDIVAFGFRDEDQARLEGSQDIKATSIWTYELAKVKVIGVGPAVREAIGRLSHEALSGFWIHLDADVLHDEDMPAVDYRIPDGLRFNELSGILRELKATGRAVGLTVSIYNPRLDAGGRVARAFVDCIVAGLS